MLGLNGQSGAADGAFKLYGKQESYSDLAREIEGVKGVLAHGLVTRAADVALVAADEAGPQVLLPQ